MGPRTSNARRRGRPALCFQLTSDQVHESCTSEAMLDGIEGDASLLTRPTTATRAHDKAIDIKVDPLEAQPRSDLEILRRSSRCLTGLLCVLSVGS